MTNKHTNKNLSFIKIVFIKERASAGFKVGDMMECEVFKAQRYISQGYAKEYVEEKKIVNKESEMPEVEVKEKPQKKVKKSE